MTLEHLFDNKELLKEALTHSGYANLHNIPSYERLEMLGDKVLNLILTEFYFKNFPQMNEGDLSVMLSRTASKRPLALISDKLGLTDMAYFAPSDERIGIKNKDSCKEDLLEAIVGAIFIDKGYFEARDFLINAFGERLQRTPKPNRDPKSKLQEYCQATYSVTPTYETVEKTGPDHSPTFKVKLKIPRVGEYFASGSNVKIAESHAAKRFLEDNLILDYEEYLD